MLSPSQVVDEYYLEVRCKLLEIGAILDRYDRAVQRTGDHACDGDERIAKCREALSILCDSGSDANRAEKIALRFSDPA